MSPHHSVEHQVRAGYYCQAARRLDPCQMAHEVIPQAPRRVPGRLVSRLRSEQKIVVLVGARQRFGQTEECGRMASHIEQAVD
jgi:hypothetical protein